jgi:hypothetical protein
MGAPNPADAARALAAAVLVVLILCVLYWPRGGRHHPHCDEAPPFFSTADGPLVSAEGALAPALAGARARMGADAPGGDVGDPAGAYPYSYALEAAEGAYGPSPRLHASDEVDALVTGQLYAGARAAGAGRRHVYGARTPHSKRWGLHEYSPAGVPGQAGIDVGPLGLREYALDPTRPDVFDDGIPEQWRFPSTPLNWFAPARGDYYDVAACGPAADARDLVRLHEPDHEPLLN